MSVPAEGWRMPLGDRARVRLADSERMFNKYYWPIIGLFEQEETEGTEILCADRLCALCFLLFKKELAGAASWGELNRKRWLVFFVGAWWGRARGKVHKCGGMRGFAVWRRPHCPSLGIRFYNVGSHLTIIPPK